MASGSIFGFVSATCAMKRIHGMEGNSRGLYQGAYEPLGLSGVRRLISVSSMPLKGTGEASGKHAPRGPAWLSSHMASSNEAG
jgi:hypothetical protein